MIFAAGLGTRLRPVTETIPKALVQVGKKTMLQVVIEKLAEAGCDEVVVNIHHLPGMIRNYLRENNYFGLTIHISDESDEILDTGGGLLKAACWLQGKDPVILHNVDIVSNVDLEMLLSYHRHRKALATLVVRNRQTKRYLLFDRDMRLGGWTNRVTGDVRKCDPELRGILKPMAFSGIHVIQPEFLNVMSGRGKFSLIDEYLRVAGNHPVYGYVDHSPVWLDIGKPEGLEEAQRLFEGKERLG